MGQHDGILAGVEEGEVEEEEEVKVGKRATQGLDSSIEQNVPCIRN
jgi:hypothetical protein